MDWYSMYVCLTNCMTACSLIAFWWIQSGNHVHNQEEITALCSAP